MKTKYLTSRILLLALGLLFACFTAKAQKIPLIDSLGTFTGNFPPAEWSRVNEGASPWNVNWGGGAPNNSGNHIYVSANAAGSNDAWMLTPQLMPTSENHTLSFYIKSDKDTIDNTVFEVMLSEGGNALKDFTVSLEQIKNESKGSGFTAQWVKQEVDMSAYVGKAVFLAFRVRYNNLVTIRLDEVAGIPLAVFDNDINLKTVFLNPGYVAFKDDQRTVCVLAENRGKTEAAVTATMKVLVSGVETATPTATKSIAAGKADTLKFNYTFAAVGSHELKVSVPADDNIINDSLSLALDVHPANSLVEDFHAGKTFPPKDWTLYSNTDPYGMKWGNTGMGATSSNGYVNWNAVYNLNDAKGQPAVRMLVTPQLKVKDGDRLSFFAKLSTLNVVNKPKEALKIYVLVSQTGVGVADFTDTLVTSGMVGDAMTADWQKYEFDLSKYKDKNIFVAFAAVDTFGIGVGVSLDEVGGDIALSSFAQDARVVMAQMDNPYHYYLAGEKVTVRARVENHGTAALSNLKVSLKANGTEASSQTLAALAAGAFSDTLKFEYTIPAAGNYTFEVCVPDDDNNINNAAGFSMQAYPVGYFIEGFEESNQLPPYWSCDKTTWGSSGWSVYNSPNSTSSYKGNGYAGSFTGCKLITPRLHLTKDDSLCFYTSTTWAESDYAVLTSVNAKDWDTLKKVTITSGGYKLQKFFFADQEESFFGDRYVAIVSLRNNMNMDEIFGPMLANREDQFALQNAFVAPKEVALAGQEFHVQAVVLNDGSKSATKTLTLYAGDKQIATANTKTVAAGAVDTVSFMVKFDEAVSNQAFHVELPEDASVFDNTFDFTAHIYQPELWRLTDGFEDVTHPWWTFVYPGTSNPWKSKPSNPLEPTQGEEYMQVCFNTSQELLAASPYLDLRYQEYEVSVDLYRDSKNPTRPDRIELAFGAEPSWKDVIFVDSVNRLPSAYPAAQEGWNHYTFKVNLKDLQKGFFLMRAVCHLNEYGSASYEYMRFDNLTIRPLFETDAEVLMTSTPVDTVWGADSVKMNLNVRLLNSGTKNLTCANIRFGVDGKEMGTFSYSGALAAGKDTLLNLTNHLNVAYKQNLKVYAEVVAENDSNAFNDRAEKNVYVKKAYSLPFVAGFEEEDWSKDWQNFTYSNDVRQSWFRDTTGEYITAPFGKACANSASLDDEVGEVNPDNWLVTPGLEIKYSKAYLSFYVQAADKTEFAEKFQVLVSTRTGEDSTLFTPVYTATLEDTLLKHVVLELNGYRGEVLHVAFRHFDCTNQYRLLLDSVYVYDPQGYNVTATVNPAEAGTVSGTGFFLKDENVSLTANANADYDFIGWYESDSEVSKENPYAFLCAGSRTLEARFELKRFDIVISAGEGGSVTPTGTVSVKYGEDLNVAIVANEGYKIEDVKVDGTSVGVVASYTFTAVSATHTLEATFSKETAVREFEANLLKVSPNPFRSQLCIDAGEAIAAVRMVDLQGREVLNRKAGGVSQLCLALNLPDGMYIVLVETTSGQRYMTRVVKSSR